MRPPIPVYLEVGSKRVFAGALDWPGWCRRGRDEGEALQALAEYAPRYADAIATASAVFVAPQDASSLEVVETLEGNATTDFGAPAMAPAFDERPLDEADLTRWSALLEASWVAFDAAVEAAVGLELRKGPRGGGRDLDKIVSHVFEADRAYLGQLGAKHATADGDPEEEMAGLRAAILEALAARSRGEPLARPRRTKNPWLPRYFVRRSAWHALDHAWEIEDRAIT